MDKEKIKNESNKFPQYLCKMCGKCCRSIISAYSREELKQMAENGSEEAKVFTEIFKAYDSIEEAKKVVPEQVEQVINELSQQENFDINKITFYYCPYITEDNKCGIYENRPDCCKRAPTGGWSCMPPGCGFEGWQFEEREKIKQKVRKYKEYLIASEAISEDGSIPGQDYSIEELRQIIEKKISPWEKYGSKFW